MSAYEFFFLLFNFIDGLILEFVGFIRSNPGFNICFIIVFGVSFVLLVYKLIRGIFL